MQTILNLTKAFIGESQARNRYTFYSKVAKKEGYEQIAAIFLETAEHEKTHAKRLFEHIQELKTNGEEIKIETTAPLIYKTTEENLQAAIDGEHYESSEMYPEFARIAEQENLLDIAKRLKAIATAEKHHEEKFKKLLEQLKTGTIFTKETEVEWTCRKCGYQHSGTQAPEKCPACDHPQSYYQVK